MVKTPSILRPLAVLLFSAVLLSCGSDDDSTSRCDDGSDPICDVCNPTENLPWLRNKIAELKNSEQGNEATLYSGTYDNQSVFVQGLCCAACLWAPTVWTCDGQRLEEAVSFHDVADQKLIWHGDDCQRYD